MVCSRALQRILATSAVGGILTMRMPPEIPCEIMYTRREEVANTVSAAVGLLVFVGVSPFVMMTAWRSAQPWALASAAIFLGSLTALYLISTLYHALAPGRAKRVARLLDHSAIFVLIAGTYTPFALGPLVDSGGVMLALIQWAIAALGIAFKLAGGVHQRRLSNLIYLCMGWFGVFWIRPFVENATWQGFFWVLAGGIAYSVGILFYTAKSRSYMHFIWHLFILMGSACHMIAVWRYAF
jgi:hemolysin III